MKMTGIDRRNFLKAAGALGALGALQTSGCRRMLVSEASRQQKPNIIFILADDLGYGDLGCYGQKTILTPNLDRFAAEGIRFTDAYAGSTVCAPSRCCLMTGYHTGHARVRGNKRHPLLPEDITVAEVLKEAGYATGIIGKWGLAEPGTTGVPNKQGFDEWFGYLNQGRAHNYYIDYFWHNEEKYHLKGRYSHDLFTERALDFVDRHKDHPFFLYLAYTLPHANNEKGRETGDGMEVPDYGPYADKDWPNPQKGHAAMITRLDRDVGRLIEQLKKLNIDDDTIIIFSSDNGPHREGGAAPEFFDSNGPLRGIKRDLYEGGIRVPTMARWPGKIAPGQVSNQVWAFWDFLPTAAELGGGRAPDGIDGVSIVPALLEGKTFEHDPLYWEFYERGYTRAVRMGRWKGVSPGLGKPLELYDLSADIGETTNVAKEHQDIVARIEEIMTREHTPSDMYKIPVPKTPKRPAQA